MELLVVRDLLLLVEKAEHYLMSVFIRGRTWLVKRFVHMGLTNCVRSLKIWKSDIKILILGQRRHKGLKKFFLNIYPVWHGSNSPTRCKHKLKPISKYIFLTWSRWRVWTMSKKKFQSKNSNGSKQTAAKICLQNRRRGFLLHIVSNFSAWKKFNTS